MKPPQTPSERASDPPSQSRPLARGRSRFSRAQIIEILAGYQAGASARDLCRRYGISTTTFYKWRARYLGEEPSGPATLPSVESRESLEKENLLLKRLLGEAVLENATLKARLRKDG